MCVCVWCVRASVGRVPARCRLVAAATRCRRLRPDPGAPFHARQELLFLQRSREESQETRPPRDPRYSSQQCARERERERERGIKNTKRKRNEEYSTRSNDRGEPPERVRQLPRATAAKGTVTRGTGSHGQNESCRPHPPSCSGAGACCGVCGLVCPQGTSSGRVHAVLARLGLCYGRREASFAQFQAAPVARGRWWGRSVGRMRMMCRKNFWVLGALQPNRTWNAELGCSPRTRRLNRTVFSVLCMYTT